jgi:hypothetical protein
MSWRIKTHEEFVADFGPNYAKRLWKYTTCGETSYLSYFLYALGSSVADEEADIILKKWSTQRGDMYITKDMLIEDEPDLEF